MDSSCGCQTIGGSVMAVGAKGPRSQESAISNQLESQKESLTRRAYGKHAGTASMRDMASHLGHRGGSFRGMGVFRRRCLILGQDSIVDKATSRHPGPFEKHACGEAHLQTTRQPWTTFGCSMASCWALQSCNQAEHERPNTSDRCRTGIIQSVHLQVREYDEVNQQFGTKHH